MYLNFIKFCLQLEITKTNFHKKYWNDVYCYTVKIMEIIPMYYYILQFIG